MNTVSHLDILKMPMNERLQLVEDIWDSIAECPEAVDLTESQKEELDNRLNAYHHDPNAGSPWAYVREKILNQQ